MNVRTVSGIMRRGLLCPPIEEEHQGSVVPGLNYLAFSRLTRFTRGIVLAVLTSWISCLAVGKLSASDPKVFPSSTTLPPGKAEGRKDTKPDKVPSPDAGFSILEGKTNSNTSPNTPSGVMDGLDDKHRLAIGDRLSFRIVEDGEDPKQLFVTDSGDMEIPYIGRFSAVGLTCRELGMALKAELEKEYYYQATVVVAVDVMAKTRGRIYLVGPVRAPGPQEILSDEILTLSKAILRAGGFGDFADKRKVRVTRKPRKAGQEEQTYTVDVAEILENGKREKDIPLEDGDLVVVPERLIRF